MGITMKRLDDAEPFGNEKKRSEVPVGKIDLKARLLIDPKTGLVKMTTEHENIKFEFKNMKIAKKWADAIR